MTTTPKGLNPSIRTREGGLGSAPTALRYFSAAIAF